MRMRMRMRMRILLGTLSLCVCLLASSTSFALLRGTTVNRISYLRAGFSWYSTFAITETTVNSTRKIATGPFGTWGYFREIAGVYAEIKENTAYIPLAELDGFFWNNAISNWDTSCDNEGTGYTTSGSYRYYGVGEAFDSPSMYGWTNTETNLNWLWANFHRINDPWYTWVIAIDWYIWNS